jgi:hypothetical protein
MLLFEEVAETGRVPFRYYAMMVNTQGCVIWLQSPRADVMAITKWSISAYESARCRTQRIIRATE